MSMAGMMSKGDYESRQKMEKKDNERKKNILILIHQYLINIGFSESATKLSEESNLELETYSVADNMDLLLIIREYEDYYYMKFGKVPIFSHKISHNPLSLFVFADSYLFQSDFWSDKGGKLLWRYFAKTFKSSYFWFRSQFRDGYSTFFFIIAIPCNIVTSVTIL